jgi:hypothetical protein
MKADKEKYIVYQIYQTSDDKVVYVGVTKNMYNRWRNHIDKTGKFNNIDYYFRQIKIYKIKKYARKYEEKLQIKYNLETDISKIHSHAIKAREALRIKRMNMSNYF